MDIILPQPIAFQWDNGNKTKSFIKHKVTCEEAEQAFLDEKKVMATDKRPYVGEKRYYLLGNTQTGRLLFIAFTIRKKYVRVISARDINKKEVVLYEKTIENTNI